MFKMSQSKLNFNDEKKEIQNWLKELFLPEDVPQFEETEESLQALFQIYLKNKNAENDVKEIINQEKMLTDLYEKKSDSLASLLNTDMLSLSEFSYSCVESLASVANQLNLKEPTLGNFIQAATAIQQKEFQSCETAIKEAYHLSELNEKLAAVHKAKSVFKRDLEYLENVVSTQEKTICENAKQTMDHYEKKKTEYQHTNKIHNETLTRNGWDESLCHHKLLETHEGLRALGEEVNAIKINIDSYQNLPPNEDLTKLKIKDMEEEVILKERELQSIIDQLE